MTDQNADQVSILLVDDRRDKLLALETVLAELNQRLVQVTSGEDALRALLKEDFAAIILDVHMPGMDGFETASLIRKRKRSEHTPIIFVTGINVTETHVTRGYSLGAVDYIFAPVEPVVLRSKVAVFIDLFKKTKQVQRQQEALRKQAEERAASLENRLEGLLNRLNVGVFQSTRQGKCIECNPALRRILGVPENKPAAEVDLSWLEIPGTSRTAERCVELKDHDGSPLWLSISTQSGTLNGSPIIEGLVEDVTQTKEAEEALRRSQSSYRTLIEALPQLVWTSLPDGSWDYMSSQWCSFTGLGSSEQAGWRWLDLLHPDDKQITQDTWNEARASGCAYDVEHRIRGANGEYRWFKTRAVPLLDDDGAVQRWFGTSTDIEDRKQSEESLRDSGKLKDDFLAMLSHELRNPLNAIHSAVQIARRKGTPETLEWSRDVIERQVKQLVRLIDDLLDVSRITRGKIQLRREDLDLSKVIEGAANACRSVIEERKHTLNVSMPSEPVYVHGDPARIEQILVNLLMNSAKYTEDGGEITVAARADDGTVFISVEDTGIGISPELQPKMFELFSQGDRSLARSKGGLGIGLTVAKKLAELHHGDLTARSEGIGKGAEFELRLPRAYQAPEQPNDSGGEAIAPRGLHVLLVDDHVDTLEGTAHLLTQIGCSVETSCDGAAAIEKAQQCNPDLILLDIGLPGLTGYEVAQALRRDPKFRDTVLVAVSGYGQEQDRKLSEESGFDAHLVKPLDIDHLFLTVTPLLTARSRKHGKEGVPKRQVPPYVTA